jgi:hypothetical protein
MNMAPEIVCRRGKFNLKDAPMGFKKNAPGLAGSVRKVIN